MRVLQVGSDRAKRGSIVPGTPSFRRQEAYAEALGSIDDISFTLRSDGFTAYQRQNHNIYPTDSSSKFFYGFDAMRIAKRLQRPDVVSSQDPFEAGLAAWRIARYFNAPFYVQVHTDFLSPAYARHSILNRARVLMAGFVLKRATRIRVVSERIKREIEATYHPRAPISVLPVFVDLEAIRRETVPPELVARFAKFRTRVLVVSRLEPEKNGALAIRAFAGAAPSDACLILVGEGSERQQLQELARSLGVNGRIFFEGGRESTPYYKIADLLLVPSRYEGYGLVIVEALAAGKPVLSTDVGVAREMEAVVSDEERFADDLARWFTNGPREGHLVGYPYRDFDEYARMYADDIAACAKEKIGHDVSS